MSEVMETKISHTGILECRFEPATDPSVIGFPLYMNTCFEAIPRSVIVMTLTFANPVSVNLISGVIGTCLWFLCLGVNAS